MHCFLIPFSLLLNFNIWVLLFEVPNTPTSEAVNLLYHFILFYLYFLSYSISHYST